MTRHIAAVEACPDWCTEHHYDAGDGEGEWHRYVSYVYDDDSTGLEVVSVDDERRAILLTAWSAAPGEMVTVDEAKQYARTWEDAAYVLELAQREAGL